MKHQTHGRCKESTGNNKGRGPSSYWLQEPEEVFAHLNLHKGMVFVDAGCGAGEYSLHAAAELGETGSVTALDCQSASVNWLNAHGKREGAAPIFAQVCDIAGRLPVASDSADIILLSTVLHIKSVRDRAANMFAEFRRALRPGGVLAILECNKEEANFGPPLHIRMSPEEVGELATAHGFVQESVLRMERSYLACFRPCGQPGA